ncbi:methionyl-tRNA formyltransferase [Coriobacteriia bacterium Es71-Z0120]|uniref:methionyl-tRNA formyltransferase n=1 Tax=Parvivirga hydrogeniphila TaxID=2939460 RepID=UPI002260C16E|nr:methionyl-tRNA formyltransferase [Parvivirga hydrogeniphila]MCL4079538.1 methionyl-tRNA formyltransferase [Parvivirga hydrogeniphila]
MRIVFMGTPSFSVPAFRALAARHDVVAVVTRPDAVADRGSAPTPSPVKSAALELGVPVHEAFTLRDPSLVGELRRTAPEAICVVAYGALLPPEVLDIPVHGCINAHASLLPSHRGAAPIERAILAGDAVTGVSIMRMEEGLDTGPVCLQVAVEIGSMNSVELSSRLAAVSADALVAALDDIAWGRAMWVPQDDTRASYAHKVTRDDVRLAPDLDVASALRRVRASSGRATVRVRLADATDIVVISAQRSETSLDAGRATLSAKGPVLGLRDGALLVTRVRPAGRREMSGGDFARGARLPAQFAWSAL